MIYKLAIINGNNIPGEYLRRLCRSQVRLTYFNISEEEIIDEDNFDEYHFPFSEKRFFRKYFIENKPTHVVSFVDYKPNGGNSDKNSIWERNVAVNEAIAKAALLVDAHFTLVSNEAVFDGKAGPYSENDKPSPADYYGKARHAAENSVLMANPNTAIIRTPLVYGYSAYYSSEVNKVLDNEKLELRDDYYTNPVYAEDLALAILKIISAGRTGCYCAGGPDYLTPYEWGLKLNQYFCNLSANILPIYVSFSKDSGKKLKYGLVNLKAETNLQMKFMGVSSAFSAIRFQADKNKYKI